MLRRYLLPLLALLGALFGLYVVFWSQRTVPVAPILFPPPKSPYSHAIAGSGLIEASSQNIAIGTPFSEIVKKVYVREGDHVKAGDILFELDLRNFNAQLEQAKASLIAAEVSQKNAEIQHSFYQRLHDRKAATEQQYEQTHYTYLSANESLKVAQANVEIAQTNVERSIIRAPIDGQILQMNVNEGELATTIIQNNAQSPWLAAAHGTLVLMGRVDPMQVRIDIDEDDAWRFEPGSHATAFVRGNSHINFPLQFVRVEPYIIPKSSFTGATVERVDTRVLQVLYNFDKGDLPVYAGQILDIFIESKPIESLIKQ